MFAGSGQLGIEALSRGAESAVFVDNAKKSLDVVYKNLEATGFSKSARVVNADSLAFLRRRAEKYDVALLDPPYHTGLLQQALQLVPEVMSEGGVIVCEAPNGEEMPETAGNMVLTKSYKYGKIKLYTYRRPLDNDTQE